MEIKILKIDNKKYPERLRNIKNPPQELYVLGDETILSNKGIAVIGSRCYTEYGKKYATKFAKELSEQNLTIISGMALGIDSFAHTACLSVEGKTIAVLGSGFNYIYPEENKELFYKIISNGGAVITEFKPNIMPNSKNFPIRNRIVSGLSCGVLVIEAAYRSGTSITAGLAKEQGKKVFCIPSNLDRTKGIGTNNLIKEGASLITCTNDILEELNLEKIQENNERKIIIPPEYINIYNAIESEATNINIICKKLKTDISQINASLMLMELEGYIKSLPGNYYEKVI